MKGQFGDRQWDRTEPQPVATRLRRYTSVACVAIGFATLSVLLYLVIRHRSYVIMSPHSRRGR